ncbi:hypothetical protein AB0940_19340 [Streptomyces sp. NPDC006656]|uniref:hypothetical protein n=1 Tax=Streptomyces sp. NPDC006656 TaxID=3156899 RepID=UPI00345601D8
MARPPGDPGHLGPDALTACALILDAPLPPAVRDHLARCPRCRRDLDGLHEVVRAARARAADDVLPPPPPRIWHSLTACLHLAPDQDAP